MSDGNGHGDGSAGTQVYVLVVEVGRSNEDGLPDDATGAALLCYAPGTDEEEAVHETVALLRTAGMSPLEVTSYGNAAEREAEGDEIDPDHRALMNRALEENAVLIVQVTPFTD